MDRIILTKEVNGMPHECKQETRIVNLEVGQNGNNINIDNLATRIDKLTGGIWALVLTLIPCALSFFAFLIWQVLITKR
jgi:hypothetical protein